MKAPPIALSEPVPVGDRYLLVRRLAMGGVADIFLARQSATAGFEKEVVIKRLRPELRNNAPVMRRFLEEARIGALLNHPNVVHVYDVDVADGAPYIAMEYIVGGELGALCRRGLAQPREGGAGTHFVPFPHAVELVRQAAAGLGYLHAKRGAEGQPLGLVHRDVSPQNLLVTEDGFLKIIDFGIAKSRRTDEATDKVMPGKLSYMAPEQVARRLVDHRADIFSLGVVLYELTLGRRLFKGPAHEVARRISTLEIEPPTFVRRSYPAALEQIVTKALALDPEQRYQSAYDLADDLEEFLHSAKLASGPVRIARYLDELGHAEGRTRRPELVTSRAGSETGDLDVELFKSFRAAPGREWDDAEEPIADVASALGLGVDELRAMRVPSAEQGGGEDARSGRARRATDLRLRNDSKPPALKPEPELAASPEPTPEVAVEATAVEPAVAAATEREKEREESLPLVAKARHGETRPPVNGSHVLPLGLGADEAAVKAVATQAAKGTSPLHEAAQAAARDEAVASTKEPAEPAGAGDHPDDGINPAAPLVEKSVAPGERREMAGFGAAMLDRAPPPHQRWVLIGISVAAALFLLYLIAS